jgi:hypothetical protein
MDVIEGVILVVALDGNDFDPWISCQKLQKVAFLLWLRVGAPDNCAKDGQ